MQTSRPHAQLDCADPAASRIVEREWRQSRRLDFPRGRDRLDLGVEHKCAPQAHIRGSARRVAEPAVDAAALKAARDAGSCPVDIEEAACICRCCCVATDPRDKAG